MPNRFRDWFRQAERDLQHARNSRRDGQHEWACFAAQQAAEKAIKALLYKHAIDVWGHVITELLDELPASVSVPSELVEKAKDLDNFYIATRYANGHPSGAPFEHYGPLQSERAINYANEIVEFARAAMA
jgi:HEPN domain-containing protein